MYTLVFTVILVPPNSPVCVGQTLSLSEVAQLLEENATTMQGQCQLAALLNFQGFVFWITRQGEFQEKTFD